MPNKQSPEQTDWKVTPHPNYCMYQLPAFTNLCSVFNHILSATLVASLKSLFLELFSVEPNHVQWVARLERGEVKRIALLREIKSTETKQRDKRGCPVFFQYLPYVGFDTPFRHVETPSFPRAALFCRVWWVLQTCIHDSLGGVESHPNVLSTPAPLV